MNEQSRRLFRTSQILRRKDFYKELSLPKNATKDEIKKSYFKLAKEFHPDVNKAPSAKDKFATVNEAYETLSDDQKRKIYD
jgi:DnaJ-class molecular chaperone